MAADGEEGSSSAPPTPPVQLPPYPEMILEAIDALDNEKGSNKTAISGYIKSKYSSSLPPLHASILTAHLARMRTTNELRFQSNNYSRPANKKEEDTSKPADAGQDGVSESAAVRVVADDSDGVPAPTTAIAPDAGDAPVKRGRGRPPKPKAPVAEAPVDASASQVATSGAGAAPVKRGRGRPPKPKAPAAEETVDAAADPVLANDTSAETTVVDAAADPVVANDTSAETTVDAAAADPVVTNDADAAPIKRGRGRPPKPKDPVAEAVAVATRGMPRARGRPPKKAKTASSNGNAEDTNAVPVKRGRGRPPKVRP